MNNVEAKETRVDLIAYFKQAGLPVSTTATRTTWGGARVPIVRLSVAERPMEHFSVDVGDEKNRVEVLSVDKDFKQLVLLVKEPKREYKVPIPTEITVMRGRKSLADEIKDLKYETKYTDPTEQKYLMGMDEKHLFISGLPKEKVRTVADAHQVLKHAEVVKAEKEGRDVKRQGEYFFVPLTKEEEKEFHDKVVAGGKRWQNQGRLQRMGHRPHFAKRLVIMRRGTKRYAQGHVTHEQHQPMYLPTWHRVYRNRETSSPGIMGFVD